MTKDKLSTDKFVLTLEPKTVDEGLQMLIIKFGSQAVREAAQRQTKTKTGRKPQPDRQDLDAIRENDAKIWLAGGEPFKQNTNRKIAKEIAARRPGQSRESTERRIMSKLSKERRVNALITAAINSKADCGHTMHIKSVRAAILLSKGPMKKILVMWREEYQKALRSYLEHAASNPPDSWSLKQISEFNREAELKKRKLLLKPFPSLLIP